VRAIVDGFMDLFSGLGVKGKDPLAGMGFTRGRMVRWDTAEALYQTNGFARRIIDLPAAEMVRAWVSLDGDTDGEIEHELTRLNVRQKLRQAVRFSRLYGGALVVMLADDNVDLTAPLNEAGVTKLRGLHVFGARREVTQAGVAIRDPMSPDFGFPEIYQISPQQGGAFRIHHSRVLRFEGVPTVNYVREQNDGWADSALTPVWDELLRMGLVQQSVAHIVRDYSQGVLGVDNLGDLLQSDEGVAAVKKRLEMLDLSRATLNTMLIQSPGPDGAGETFAKVSSSLAGMPDVMDRFAQHLAAVTAIPVTLLMGQSPAGLQATGASDIRQFYDRISSDQEDQIRPPLERLIDIITVSREGPTNGKKPDDLAIRFNPLWQLDEKQRAEIYKLTTEADMHWINTAGIDPEEMHRARFGAGAYDPDAAPEWTEEEVLPTEADLLPQGGGAPLPGGFGEPGDGALPIGAGGDQPTRA